MPFLSFVLESPYVNTLPIISQKQFIFGHLAPCSMRFGVSVTSDMKVRALGGARDQNLEHIRFFFFYKINFI